jgi:hypothetical protein
MKLNQASFFLLTLSIIGLPGCSTPELSNIKTCETLEVSGKCQNDVSVFQNKQQKVFVSADLQSVPNATKVKFDWKYTPSQGTLSNREIPLTSITIQTKGSDKFVVSSLSSPSQGWQVGNYKVEIYLPAVTNSSPSIKEFTVTP